MSGRNYDFRLMTCTLLFAAIFVAALCPWAGTPIALASQYAKYELSGTVSDDEGNTLAGVQVLAIDEVSGSQRAAVTSSDGLFTISGLESGSYNISFELEGFETHDEFAVQVQADAGVLEVILQRPDDGDC